MWNTVRASLIDMAGFDGGSEADLGLEQKLNGFDAGIGIQRECDIGVPHVAERGTGAENAQAESDIAEPARIDGILVVAAPRAAHVEEHRAANAKQAERIPVGVDALLESEQRTPVSTLVAQRVAAQAVVPAQLQKVGNIGVPDDIAGNACEEERAFAVWRVVAHGAAVQLVLAPAAPVLPGQGTGHQQAVTRWQLEAVAHFARVQPYLAG